MKNKKLEIDLTPLVLDLMRGKPIQTLDEYLEYGGYESVVLRELMKKWNIKGRGKA